MAYRLSNGHVTDDLTWPWKVKLVTPIRLERNISKTIWAKDFKFNWYAALYRECLAGAQIIFPEKGRALGHVILTIFGIRSNISLKLLELETSNMNGLYGQCRAGAQINFPESGRNLGHVTPTIFGSTVGYPSDSLASCYLWNSTVIANLLQWPRGCPVLAISPVFSCHIVMT